MAAKPLKTEEDKTLYALGLSVGQSLKTFSLTPAELERVKEGMSDAVTGAKPKVEIQDYMSKLNELAKARQTAASGLEKKKGEEYAAKAAKEKGVLAFGNMTDQHDLAPEVVVTGAVWDMYPTVKHSIDAVREGQWTAGNLKEWSMMAKGGASLAPFHDFEQKLPASVVAEVRDLEAKILAGQFEVPVVETELKTD